MRYAGGGHQATQQENSRWEGRVRQVESLDRNGLSVKSTQHTWQKDQQGCAEAGKVGKQLRMVHFSWGDVIGDHVVGA